LLLVIATIAILVLLMLPQYSAYIKQAKLTEAFGLFAGARTDVSMQYALYGELSAQTPIKTEGKYVEQLQILPQALVRVNFKDPELPILTFKPQLYPNASAAMLMAWQCSSADVRPKSRELLPRLCR
jgi:type II secretory pathway pseudopilin PulG